MLCLAAFLVCLLCQSSAESVGVKYRCNDSSIDPNVSYSTFTPSLDGVQGRYTAELCTFRKPNRTLLTMDLTYNEHTTVCDSNRLRRPGRQHSINTVDVAGLANCSHVCYAMDFDLIFSSCYLLKSTLNEISRSHSPHDAYYLINNNVTKQLFDNIKPHVNIVNHPDYFTLDWFLGIPAVDYTVILRKINNDTGSLLDEGTNVTANCSLLGNVRQLRCELAPPHACYQASFEHGGPWITGVFNSKNYLTTDHLCHLLPDGPTVPVRSAAVWWVGGAALLGAAALLAAAALRRRLRAQDYHKRVLDFWFNNRSSEAEAQAQAPAPRDSRAVLLLYAREGELGQQAMAALRDLIQHSTGGIVYDLFAPEVMALCGPAPHSWVRALLQRDDVRVLLLQSPAAAALYRDRLADDEAGLRLRAPLLGRRAMYRAPHYGDQLLSMALRYIAETPDMHHAYNKYYLATYSGLETDIVPQVVSYRRYELPGAARVLCAHLGAGAAQPERARLQRYERAAHALLAHAMQHPDYLMDEIFIH